MPAPPCGNYGDVDGDGDVTSADVGLANDMVFNPDNYTSEQKKRADVNGDGKVTMIDVGLIYNFEVGSITTFPVCEQSTEHPISFIVPTGAILKVDGVEIL